MEHVKEKRFVVYKHTNVENGKVYIGITCRKPNIRWANGKGYKSCKVFNNAINKYGWDKFKSEILFENLSKEDAENKEIELIKLHNANNHKFGYNVHRGGVCLRVGLKHKQETKIKMSKNHADFREGKSPCAIKIICLDTLEIFDSATGAARKLGLDNVGINNVLRNKAKSCGGLHFEYLKDYNPDKKYDLSVGQTEETKLKISRSKKGFSSWNKGKKHSEESIQKMREAHSGKFASPETKQKMSISHLNNSNSKKVICLETGKIFPSASEAGRVLGLSHGNICSVCQGLRKSTGKLHFKYYINGDKK